MGLCYSKGVRLACMTLPYRHSDLLNLFLHCFFNSSVGM